MVNVPTAVSPLAKSKLEQPELTNRFQIIIAGSEVGNGFSELNDPLDQLARFEEQQALRDAGDVEAQMADYEYVEALMHGMPPAAGFGVSERLFCFLEDKPIRETQIFPLMKPLHEQHVSTSTEVDMSAYGDLPSLAEAENLMKKYLTDTYQHCKQVGHVMRHFAKQLQQPENLWYIA
ncbi:MAG: hypothetical protein H6765_11130 [Candidatus Peribacteria bacterium]|nr:MAG: hypothetical protein H6765_11130 [Candidatus Peribacteria bacterium]